MVGIMSSELSSVKPFSSYTLAHSGFPSAHTAQAHSLRVCTSSYCVGGCILASRPPAVSGLTKGAGSEYGVPRTSFWNASAMRFRWSAGTDSC